MAGMIADTTVWVDIERRLVSRAALATASAGEPVFVAPVTIAELQYGLSRATTEQQRSRRLAALSEVKAMNCLPIGAETGEVFGRLAADLDSRGRPSKHRTQDLWIASLALQHGLKVLTQNRKDFDDIPGLTVVLLSP
ncbi:MAG: type II toxin-antitoxin system VapC family toxin [Planctomycetes bacterium]|nr:type II toxin-antitoxin system VapC family toxin [Planctomycetota bacterium]